MKLGSFRRIAVLAFSVLGVMAVSNAYAICGAYVNADGSVAVSDTNSSVSNCTAPTVSRTGTGTYVITVDNMPVTGGYAPSICLGTPASAGAWASVTPSATPVASPNSPATTTWMVNTYNNVLGLLSVAVDTPFNFLCSPR